MLRGHVGKIRYSFEASYLAVITTKSGKKIRVHLNYNSELRKVSIKEQSDIDFPVRDSSRFLFRSAD